jgi:hypothetical protein
VSVRSKNGINGNSARNNHHTDKESTRGMGIPAELPAHEQRSLLKNGYSSRNYLLRDEEYIRGMGIHQKLLAHRCGIHPRNGILLGITSLWTLVQALMIKMCEESSEQ